MKRHGAVESRGEGRFWRLRWGSIARAELCLSLLRRQIHYPPLCGPRVVGQHEGLGVTELSVGLNSRRSVRPEENFPFKRKGGLSGGGNMIGVAGLEGEGGGGD